MSTSTKTPPPQAPAAHPTDPSTPKGQRQLTHLVTPSPGRPRKEVQAVRQRAQDALMEAVPELLKEALDLAKDRSNKKLQGEMLRFLLGLAIPKPAPETDPHDPQANALDRIAQALTAGAPPTAKPITVIDMTPSRPDDDDE